MYLDGGFDAADAFIRRSLLNPDSISESHSRDYKTELQELVQQKPGRVISYVPAGESGPDHAKLFLFKVCLDGETVGEGSGRTKKEAEQAAACEALKKMNK